MRGQRSFPDSTSGCQNQWQPHGGRTRFGTSRVIVALVALATFAAAFWGTQQAAAVFKEMQQTTGIISMAGGAGIVVDSAADTNARDGVVTLREAILLATGGLAVGTLDAGEADNVTGSPGAGSPDTITFDPAVFPSGSPATINLGSGLPSLSIGIDTIDGSAAGVIIDGVTDTFTCFTVAGNGNTIKGLDLITNCGTGIYINGTNNTIGGTTAAEHNVISGNAVIGVLISGIGTSGNVVKGNYIGTNAAGTAAIPNTRGVKIQQGAHDNTIGGTTAGERNVISGNSGHGIWIRDTGTNGNTVLGNYIGTNAAGTAAIPNTTGVLIGASAQDNTIGGTAPGERNVISANSGAGITIESSSNTVSGNYIGTNAAGTAAVPNGVGVAIVGIGAQGNTIGGTIEGERNVISGNGIGVQIALAGANGNTVSGNYIGIDAAGTAAIPNTTGVRIQQGAQGNTIGGTTPGERNVISGNSLLGIGITIAPTSGNTVKGNYIGTDATGAAAIPNFIGVRIAAGAQGNTIGGTTIGEGNTIAFSTGDGLLVDGATTTGNTIRGNSIHSNGGKGIENINGGNTELTPPIIAAAGSASGTACANCTVDVYSDDADEGRTYHGSATADGSGNWSFGGAVTGPNITATTTDGGNTSEFSAPFDCNADSDGDTWTNCQEGYITTDHLNACTPGGWPPDARPLPGGNGVVQIDDVTFAASAFGSTTTPRAEIASQNGVVQIDDVTAFASRFGDTC